MVKPWGSKYQLILSLLLGIFAALLTAIVLAWPWQATIEVGGLYDHPYMHDFHAAEYSREHHTSFRWSRANSAIVLPGVGKLAPLTLRIHGDYPGMTIGMDAGTKPFDVHLRHGWQRVWLLPKPNNLSGDVRIALHAPVQVSVEDERERGVVISRIELSGCPYAPPLLQILLISLNIVLITMLFGWLSSPNYSLGAGLLFIVLHLVVLATDHGAYRLMLTNYTARLTLVLLCGMGLLLAIDTLLVWLSNHHILRITFSGRRLLIIASLVTFFLRFGGMAYPLNFISDIRFTMARATMVREGRLLELFLPNPSLTPVQWETEATIPRSPLYYILASPLTALPGTGARLSVMALSSIIDALAVLIVALIVLHAGKSSRAAMMAAFLAGVSPIGLLAAVSWGLFPTLLAQCLILLAMLVWLYTAQQQKDIRNAWLIVTTPCTLAFVSYPTALLFWGTTWAICVFLLMIQQESSWILMLWAGLVALVASFVLFYGWHIPAMVEKTMPVLIGKASGTNSGQDSISISDVIGTVWIPLRDKYGYVVLGMAASGMALLSIKPLPHPVRNLRTLLIAWLLTYPPMALMSRYVVTFILKDVLYMLPLLAILAGIFLGRLVHYRLGKIVVATVLIGIFWQGFVQELDAIVHAFVQLK